MNGFLRETFLFVREFAKIVIVSLLIILPVRHFIVQPFFVRGASMEPSFDNGDYLIIDEASYHFRDPQRGEVIVFRFPDNPSQYYIKRIIGLPEEKVEVRNGEVWVSRPGEETAQMLEESYLPYQTYTSGTISITLAENEIFVMGDNRIASYDSRQWGALPMDYIVGRTWMRLWPMKDFEIIQ
jgi:signal peptidase I